MTSNKRYFCYSYDIFHLPYQLYDVFRCAMKQRIEKIFIASWKDYEKPEKIGRVRMIEIARDFFRISLAVIQQSCKKKFNFFLQYLRYSESRFSLFHRSIEKIKYDL